MYFLISLKYSIILNKYKIDKHVYDLLEIYDLIGIKLVKLIDKAYSHCNFILYKNINKI